MLHMKEECGILSSSGAAGRRSCASSSRVVQAPTSSLQMENTSGVHFTNGIAFNKPLAPRMILLPCSSGLMDSLAICALSWLSMLSILAQVFVNHLRLFVACNNRYKRLREHQVNKCRTSACVRRSNLKH